MEAQQGQKKRKCLTKKRNLKCRIDEMKCTCGGGGKKMIKIKPRYDRNRVEKNIVFLRSLTPPDPPHTHHPDPSPPPPQQHKQRPYVGSDPGR